MFGIIPSHRYSQMFQEYDFNWRPDYELILKYQVLPLGQTDTITLAVVVVSGLWSAGTFYIVGLWGYNHWRYLKGVTFTLWVREIPTPGRFFFYHFAQLLDSKWAYMTRSIWMLYFEHQYHYPHPLYGKPELIMVWTYGLLSEGILPKLPLNGMDLRNLILPGRVEVNCTQCNSANACG